MAEAPPRQDISPEERARLSPAGLARLTVPKWAMLPVTDLINRVFFLCALASLRPHDRDLDKWRRVVLALPPRTGKSEICSINGPAWYLGHNPDNTVAVISYAADFAQGFGALARNALKSQGAAVFGISTDPSSEAKDWWSTYDYRKGVALRGGMRAMGVDGQLIGKGFNLIIVDDPIKNAQDALSSLVRDQFKNLWQSTVKNRLEPGGSAMIVSQRWHEDDPAGYVLREEGLYTEVGRDGWTPIIVPLRAEAITSAHVPGLKGELPDPLGRQPGELLRTRFTEEELEGREKTTPAFWWNAQYQQRPAVAEGTLFKRDSLRYYEVLPDYYRLRKSGVNWLVPRNACMVVVTTDLAASLKTSADYFTLGFWAVTPQRDLLLLDVIRGRYEGPEQDSIIEGAWKTFYPRPAFVAIESVAYQLTMVQRMRRKGIAVRPVSADRDKYSRAVVAATRFNNEGFFLPAAPRDWKLDYVTELLNFPNAPHDDYVDMTAYAAIVIEPGNLPGAANIRVIG